MRAHATAAALAVALRPALSQGPPSEGCPQFSVGGLIEGNTVYRRRPSLLNDHTWWLSLDGGYVFFWCPAAADVEAAKGGKGLWTLAEFSAVNSGKCGFAFSHCGLPRPECLHWKQSNGTAAGFSNVTISADGVCSWINGCRDGENPRCAPNELCVDPNVHPESPNDEYCASGPTAVPTGHPRHPPTASPSQEPTAVPVIPPSESPSNEATPSPTSPTAGPTAAPTGITVPTAPPSSNASAAPGGPTAGPTEYIPLPYQMIDVLNLVVLGLLLLSAITGGCWLGRAGAGMARYTLVVRAMTCPEPDGVPEKFGYALNPFQLELSDASVRHAFGAEVSCLVIFMFFFILLCIIMICFLCCCRRADDRWVLTEEPLKLDDPEYDTKLPYHDTQFRRMRLVQGADNKRALFIRARLSWLAVPANYLYCGLTMGGFTTLLDGMPGQQLFSAIVIAVFTVGFPAYVVWAARRGDDYAKCGELTGISCCRWFIFGGREWWPQRQSPRSLQYHELHGNTYGRYKRGWRRYWLGFELLYTLCLCGISSWDTESRDACVQQTMWLCGMSGIFGFLTLFTAPYLAPIEIFFNTLISVTQATMMGLMSASYMQSLGESHGKAGSTVLTAAEIIAVVLLWVIFVKFLIDFAIWAYMYWSLWRQHTRNQGSCMGCCCHWFCWRGKIESHCEHVCWSCYYACGPADLDGKDGRDILMVEDPYHSDDDDNDTTLRAPPPGKTLSATSESLLPAGSRATRSRSDLLRSRQSQTSTHEVRNLVEDSGTATSADRNYGRRTSFVKGQSGSRVRRESSFQRRSSITRRGSQSAITRRESQSALTRRESRSAITGVDFAEPTDAMSGSARRTASAHLDGEPARRPSGTAAETWRRAPRRQSIGFDVMASSGRRAFTPPPSSLTAGNYDADAGGTYFDMGSSRRLTRRPSARRPSGGRGLRRGSSSPPPPPPEPARRNTYIEMWTDDRGGGDALASSQSLSMSRSGRRSSPSPEFGASAQQTDHGKPDHFGFDMPQRLSDNLAVAASHAAATPPPDRHVVVGADPGDAAGVTLAQVRDGSARRVRGSGPPRRQRGASYTVPAARRGSAAALPVDSLADRRDSAAAAALDWAKAARPARDGAGNQMPLPHDL